MTIRDPFHSILKDLDREVARKNLQQQQQGAKEARERRLAKYREENARAEKERATQREAARKAAVDAEAANLKERYRLIFLSTPGSADVQFEREWPAMLRQIQIEQTLGGQSLTEEYAAMRRASLASVPE